MQNLADMYEEWGLFNGRSTDQVFTEYSSKLARRLGLAHSAESFQSIEVVSQDDIGSRAAAEEIPF